MAPFNSETDQSNNVQVNIFNCNIHSSLLRSFLLFYSFLIKVPVNVDRTSQLFSAQFNVFQHELLSKIIHSTQFRSAQPLYAELHYSLHLMFILRVLY